jgi:hypothetical protein
MSYPGYLSDRIELGYKCENDLKPITFRRISNEMLSLIGIKQISILVENQDFQKSACTLGAGVLLAVAAASGGNLPPISTSDPPLSPTPIERVISIQNGGGEGPSNFPSPVGNPGRPSSTGTGKGLVPYVPYVNPYRVPPKVVNSGLGAGANPAGAGGGGGAAEFDDQCPAPKKKQQSQKSDINEFQSTISNSKKKKKQEADQCELNENITHKINEEFESNAVKKLVKTALGNQRVKQEYEVIRY